MPPLSPRMRESPHPGNTRPTPPFVCPIFFETSPTPETNHLRHKLIPSRLSKRVKRVPLPSYPLPPPSPRRGVSSRRRGPIPPLLSLPLPRRGGSRTAPPPRLTTRPQFPSIHPITPIFRNPPRLSLRDKEMNPHATPQTCFPSAHLCPFRSVTDNAPRHPRLRRRRRHHPRPHRGPNPGPRPRNRTTPPPRQPPCPQPPPRPQPQRQPLPLWPRSPSPPGWKFP